MACPRGSFWFSCLHGKEPHLRGSFFFLLNTFIAFNSILYTIYIKYVAHRVWRHFYKKYRGIHAFLFHDGALRRQEQWVMWWISRKGMRWSGPGAPSCTSPHSLWCSWAGNRGSHNLQQRKGPRTVTESGFCTAFIVNWNLLMSRTVQISICAVWYFSMLLTFSCIYYNYFPLKHAMLGVPYSKLMTPIWDMEEKGLKHG